MDMHEEVSRILTDRLSSLLFCPTNAAFQNLKNEKYGNFNYKIINSGDIMQDGAIFYKNLLSKPNIKLQKEFTLYTNS